MPHDPSTTGFMATHGTHRFLAMHEQTGLLVGEGKHGVWRFQENGFIRVYRNNSEGIIGIPADKKEVVLDFESVQEGEEDAERNRLFKILQYNYKNYDPKFKDDFNYPFNKTFKAPEISEDGSLNWIDLPIYHPKFNNTYEDHVPIDLPLFYCQVNISA